MKKANLILGFFSMVMSIIIAIKVTTKNESSQIIREVNHSAKSYPIFDSTNGFIVLGGNIKDVQVVGVVHKSFGGIGIDENNNNLNLYNKFWDLYLKETKKDPSSIIIAPEAGKDVTGKIGKIYQLGKPASFITDYLFEVGINKIVTCNNRPDYGVEDQKEFASLLNIFYISKGSMEVTNSYDSFSLPIVKVKDTPKLTDSDHILLKNIWYNKYYLPNISFENMLAESFVQPNIVPVVGATHALNMYKKGQVKCVALTVSKNDFILTLKSLELQNYYLEKIR